ncbi:hypothetical protein PAHAL_9G156400 [Panicum hallii]|uniref:DUF7595 domain-containing protein n=1 Tax=Panicum hallii TaxID=206008 RepID=A0A2S3IJV6_9POAL|nr:hypothetical protein PAHAL_9G156400 [Panicum hallii]
MPPRKRRRAFIAPPSPDHQTTVTTPRRPPEEEVEPSALTTLPADLLPEIAARSDVTRRSSRSPCVLGFLHAYDKARMGDADQDRDRPPAPAPCFSAAHPATPGVAYLGGDRSSDICVYDPMSGSRTFLPPPPGIRIRDRRASEYGVYYTYVLLTAADGIGDSSFLLLATDFTGLEVHSANITVQTVSSDNADGTCPWGPVTMAAHPRSRWYSVQPHCGAVVLPLHILTYDVGTATAGSIELPKHSLPQNCKVSNLHLASSPDGRLSLHVANKLKISGSQELFPYEIDLEARLSAMKTF